MQSHKFRAQNNSKLNASFGKRTNTAKNGGKRHFIVYEFGGKRHFELRTFGGKYEKPYLCIKIKDYGRGYNSF